LILESLSPAHSGTRPRRLTPVALVVAVVTVVAAVLVLPGSALPAATEPVRLEIANAKSGSLVRCQLVLAHFVTLAPDRIGPDHRATIELQRDVRAGTLFYRRADGPPMALETVLCGLDDDWAATRNDLDLRRLRGGEGDRLLIVCEGEQGLACAAPPQDRPDD
jgi:hypothetical protein